MVRLELPVEHTSVGHHDDRIEDAPIVLVVQYRELVGEPGDSEALAAAGRMLDQITLAGAVVACVAYEPADAVELLVAREDEEVLAGSAPAVVLPLNLVDELADQVEDAVSRPDSLPEVVGRIAGAGWAESAGSPRRRSAPG